MTCPACTSLERANAQLKRDLEAAQEAVTHFKNKWLEAVEKKGSK